MDTPSSTEVAVIGLGYIGLPTAIYAAISGFSVAGVDLNPKRRQEISQGLVDDMEPDLAGLLRQAHLSNQFYISEKLPVADVYVICVPTPLDHRHRCDTAMIESVVEQLLKILKQGDLIILESTSPVGTTRKLIYDVIQHHRPDICRDIFVAHCPERVIPGLICQEFLDNDRIIGGVNHDSTVKAAEFYRRFARGEVIETEDRMAELCKLAENSYRDVNIAFSNQISMLCADIGLNPYRAIELINRHPRVNALLPGPGVGGHCLAVDPWFLCSYLPQEHDLIKQARLVNKAKTAWVVEQVKQVCGGNNLSKVAIFGLTYKKDATDLRESPAVEIVTALEEGADYQILACDDHVREFELARLCDWREAIDESEVLVFLVAHSHFSVVRDLDLSSKRVMDFCGFFSDC